MDDMIPKVLGADVELANFVLGETGRSGAAEAARALLEAFVEVTGAVGHFDNRERNLNHHDWARFYLPTNGACAYIDAHHLELCTSEQRGAHGFVAAWHGMLLLAQRALHHANRDRGSNRILALVDNADGRVSYGSHLNLLVTRRVWQDVIERKPHLLALLASYQACSLVLTGQGRVVGPGGGEGRSFELSQRARYLESLIGPQTTFRRPLVNTRDEAHCGGWAINSDREAPSNRYARLHVIAYDSSLCEVGALLKVGGLQILLAMFEARCPPLALALDDPVDAARLWSEDPLLERRVPLLDGREVTAVELQTLFVERMRGFADRTSLEGVVPRAGEIVSLWEATLDQLVRRDWSGLARRLDWALKLGLIERAIHHNPELNWDSPGVSHLDRVYASLDPGQGLYWALRQSDGVESVVAPGAIELAAVEPPDDTRAWARAQLLRRTKPSELESVDWDHVRIRLRDSADCARSWRVNLPSPLLGTRRDLEEHFNEGRSLGEVVRSLGADPEFATVQSGSGGFGTNVNWVHQGRNSYDA